MSVLQKTSKELPFDQFYLLPEHLNRYPRSQYPLFRSQIGKPLRLISIVGGLSGKPGHVNNALEQRAFNVDQFALIVTLIFGGKKMDHTNFQSVWKYTRVYRFHLATENAFLSHSITSKL